MSALLAILCGVWVLCDFCLKHGGGKKWYENEANFSKKLFEEEETQVFMHDYFSRSIEKSKQTFEENLRSAAIPALKRIVEPKLQDRYQNYLHHQVVPTEVASQIIRTASRACRFSCVCRKRYSDSTKYCVGLGFVLDVAAKYPDYTTGVEELSIEEAIEFVQRLDSEKIVHSVSALRVPYVGMVCNCDLRVCAPYRYRVTLGIKSAMYKSECLFKIDPDKCSQCGECLKKCLFGAVKVDENGFFIDKEQCFGCGMCRTVCEEKAIVSMPRTTIKIKEIW